MSVTSPVEVPTGSYRQKLQRLEQEVAMLRRQLAKAQNLATVGTMAAMIAHEFNNILTPIINYAQLAQDNPTLAPKAIAKAAEGGQRASNICKAILGISSPSDNNPVKVNLLELVQLTVEAMARDPERDGIDLAINIPKDLNIVTRPTELQHVLLNLLLNARSALLAGAGSRRIEISAGKAGRQVELAVSDTGIGIDPVNLDRIFKPFFTTRDGSDGTASGTGLGLTFCRDTVEKLGGTINVHSVLGKGSTFTINLPAVAKASR